MGLPIFNEIILLITFIACVIFIASFLEFKSLVTNKTAHFFLSSIVTTTIVLSTVAIFSCKAKTIFLIFPITLIYLIFTKSISINFNSYKNQVLSNIKYLVLIFPILGFQLFLNFNFNLKSPYLVSDDIYLYAGISKQMLEFGQENTSAYLYGLYPTLFNGVQPYHYFELWLNNFFNLINKNAVNNLIFVTYPVLLWVLSIGFLAILEHFKIKKYKLLILLLLFFVGPIYDYFYHVIFNDGNFFNSVIFTVNGFVKQTLPFSYYGQKHLPIYIFSVAIILNFLKNQLHLALFSIIGACISSIGVFPGLFSSTFIFFILSNEKQKKYKPFIFTFISLILLLVISKIFQIGVTDEITYKTSYLKFFLKDLNLKGEILRAIQKIFFPFIWFGILYFPYLLFFKYRQIIPFIKKNYLSLTFVLIAFLSSTFLTIFLYGINSDQFVTNLIPFLNVILITLLIKKLSNIQEKAKLSLIFITGLSIISSYNVYETIKFHFIPKFKSTLNETYSIEAQRKTLNAFKKTNPKFIAYLISKEDEIKFHPIHYHPYMPGKFIMNENYFNLVNINYPYREFKFSSSSDVFSPRNQLKYFISKEKLENKSFDSIQYFFLKKYKIKWLFCKNESMIPKIFKDKIKLKIEDKKTNEKYLLLNLR